MVEAERPYEAVFPNGATHQQRGAQILRDLEMDGAHNVARPAADGTLTITRHDLVRPRRLIYKPAEAKVVIEAAELQTPALLERMHRRRGYQHPFLLDDVWAVLVDVVILAIIVWALSGLWMWWEMRVTRRNGALFGVAGLALFVLFLVTI
jgi:hypothetical protein